MKLARIKKRVRDILRPHPGRGQKAFLFSYLKDDGSFDYDAYKSVQIEGNKRKLDRVWAREKDIEFLADYLRKHVPQPSFGICHGTRRGEEQKWFREKLSCEVIGTEISDTADQFEHTVQWDFHDENPAWIGKADFVYSNSLDHAYDPKRALTAWMRTLRPGGVCIIEHTAPHGVEYSTKLDPFGASLDVMPYLVLDWSEGAFSVRELLQGPPVQEGEFERTFLILKNT